MLRTSPYRARHYHGSLHTCPTCCVISCRWGGTIGSPTCPSTCRAARLGPRALLAPRDVPRSLSCRAGAGGAHTVYTTSHRVYHITICIYHITPLHTSHTSTSASASASASASTSASASASTSASHITLLSAQSFPSTARCWNACRMAAQRVAARPVRAYGYAHRCGCRMPLQPGSLAARWKYTSC